MPDFNVLTPIIMQLNLIIIKPVNIHAIDQSNLIDLLFLKIVENSAITKLLFNISILEVNDRVPVLKDFLLDSVLEKNFLGFVTVNVGKFVVDWVFAWVGDNASGICETLLVLAVLWVVFVAEKVIDELRGYVLDGKMLGHQLLEGLEFWGRVVWWLVIVLRFVLVWVIWVLILWGLFAKDIFGCFAGCFCLIKLVFLFTELICFVSLLNKLVLLLLSFCNSLVIHLESWQVFIFFALIPLNIFTTQIFVTTLILCISFFREGNRFLIIPISGWFLLFFALKFFLRFAVLGLADVGCLGCGLGLAHRRPVVKGLSVWSVGFWTVVCLVGWGFVFDVLKSPLKLEFKLLVLFLVFFYQNVVGFLFFLMLLSFFLQLTF